jgi:hypothetical protein
MAGVAYEQFYVNERTSAKITATLTDEEGAAVPSATLESLELWLFEKTRKSIVNSRGTLLAAGQDVLTPGSHGVSLHPTSGLLTWQLSPADTECVLTTPPKTPTVDETHVAVFKGIWGNGLRGFTTQIEIIITDMVPEVNP